MKRTLGLAVAFLTLVSPLSAQGRPGSICVAPIPLPADQPSALYGPIMFNRATLSVRIDHETPILWPNKDGVKIPDLDTKQSHLVTVLSDGKPIQSFRFRFSNFKTSNLCLSFDGFPPDLRDAKQAPWCRCK